MTTIKQLQDKLSAIETISTGNRVRLINLPEYTTDVLGNQTPNPYLNLVCEVLEINDGEYTVKDISSHIKCTLGGDNVFKLFTVEEHGELKTLREQIRDTKTYIRCVDLFDLPLTKDVVLKWESIEEFLPREKSSWGNNLPRLNVTHNGFTFHCTIEGNKLYPKTDAWPRRNGYSNLDTLISRIKEYIPLFQARKKAQDAEKTRKALKIATDKQLLASNFPLLTVKESRYRDIIADNGKKDWYNTFDVTINIRENADPFILNLRMELTAEKINAILAIVE